MTESAEVGGASSGRIVAMLLGAAIAVAEWCWLPRLLAHGDRAFNEGTGLLLYATIPAPLFAVLLASRWALRAEPVRAWRCVAAAAAAFAVCALPALHVMLAR